MDENVSMVARLRAQLEADAEAYALLFHGPAIMASHRSITSRMERIGASIKAHTAELAEIVGEKEAERIAGQALADKAG
jgi:hypothetical protein